MNTETREHLETLAGYKNAEIEAIANLEKVCLSLDIENPDEFSDVIENRFSSHVYRIAQIENISFDDAVALVWDNLNYDSYGSDKWFVENK
jgi:hypothetical protein